MSGVNIHLIRLDPYDPHLGLLVPIVSQRIMEFAREHSKELDPHLVAQAAMVPLWNRDPFTLVLAMVNVEGTVVGHAVGAINSDGVNYWLAVSQTQADGAVGDAVKRSVDYAKKWVESEVNPRLLAQMKNPVTHMVLITGRNEKAWERAYGFKLMRRVMALPLFNGEEGVEGSE